MRKDNVYIHDPNLAYPDKDFAHMVIADKVHDYVYDESFPYRLKDPKSKFIKFWVKVVIFLIVKLKFSHTSEHRQRCSTICRSVPSPVSPS